MAGPSCAILLPCPLTREERRAVLAELFEAVGDRRWDGLGFSVVTTKSIGGSYAGEGRPFVLGFHSLGDDDPIGLVADAFGFEPEEGLEVGAMSNQAVDHRILAEVCAWLADRLGGVIDIGDQLPLPPDHPGRHVASPCASEKGWGELAPAHIILDATALRAWIKQPDFWMVK